MPPTSPSPVPAGLYSQIKIVCDMMLRTHYFEEANWTWMAVASQASCASPVARNALQSAATVASQFGFREVSTWIETEVLRQKESREPL